MYVKKQQRKCPPLKQCPTILLQIKKIRWHKIYLYLDKKLNTGTVVLQHYIP